jgi:hypothetical protein
MQSAIKYQNCVRATAICVVVLAACNIVPAQQTMTSATLSGRVEDSSGAVIKTASIVAKRIDTSQEQTTKSDGDGRFRFPYLPVGTYEISVAAAGFAPLTRQLTLSVGQALDLPVKLAVENIKENVNVTAGLPVIETVRTQLAETVLPREIDSLPLNGRNYLDLAALTPGVTRSNPVANQRFPETSAVPGTGLSITGQRFINNGFVVDGLSANDDAADLPGTFYSQEVVREFEVITSGGIAEFGRASGGFVNIVTQSGTNSLHGRFYGFLRSQHLDAQNPVAPVKDPLTQAQYGTSLGGPIARNRTFFFANFEQTRLHNAAVIVIKPGDVATVNSRLDAISFAGPRISTGLAPTGFNSTNFLIRADHQVNKANQLTARYSLYEIDSINARNVGGLNAVSRGTALQNRDQTIAVSDVAILTSKTINEARFQYTRSRLDAPVNDEVGPAINISGVASFGTATFSPTARDLDTYEVVDTLTTQRGSHSFKLGANYLHNRVNITFPGPVQSVYSFSSLPNFLTNRYSTFQQAFGDPGQVQSNPNIGLFAQHEWRPNQNLTLNAGLRYDLQYLPDPITTDANNFGPRVGLAYAPGDRKTVIRGSFGIYFDRLPLRATSNALQRDGTKYKIALIPFGLPGVAPAFPNTLSAFPGNLPVSITTIDPNIKNSYNEQASVQVERELFPSTSLSVGYLQTRGLHLILSRNLNVPRFPTSAGVPNQGRPDPRFANVGRFESSGTSSYNAMTVALNRRFQRWFGVRLSYTLSQAIDNAGNAFFFTPQNNFNLNDDRGPSDNDQRHRVALSGTFETPSGQAESKLRRLRGFQLSYIFSYSSRLPFNVIRGDDLNFDTNLNDRPIGVARNSGKGFDFASLDLRLGRRFHLGERLQLETLVEAFNVLNRANLQLPINVFGTLIAPASNFGQPSGAADPRQLQFGLRLSF